MMTMARRCRTRLGGASETSWVAVGMSTPSHSDGLTLLTTLGPADRIVLILSG